MSERTGHTLGPVEAALLTVTPNGILGGARREPRASPRNTRAAGAARLEPDRRSPAAASPAAAGAAAGDRKETHAQAGADGTDVSCRGSASA